jgi:hypothetical protein
MKIPPILEVGGVLISSEIITECFCCDYEKCKGICCVEGDAGAPVTLDEIADIEDCLDTVWPDLSASAQSVIDKQGVAYADRDGDMVTSIVRGRECVFARSFTPDPSPKGEGSQEPCWLCMLERAYRNGKTRFCKPISCSLYPIREKNFGNGLIGLNYHRWEVCRDAVKKGKALGLPVYQFLKEPLTRRFGEAWYQELCEVAAQLTAISLPSDTPKD